jgi:hypothetical protein
MALLSRSALVGRRYRAISVKRQPRRASWRAWRAPPAGQLVSRGEEAQL